MAEYLCDYLNAAGIPARVDRIDETHANVVAMLEGTSDAGPVIWNGHLGVQSPMVPEKTGIRIRQSRLKKGQDYMEEAQAI